MTDAAEDRASAVEINRLLDEVDYYARRLGKPRGRLLDVATISYATGIPAERVVELLHGQPPLMAPEGRPEARKAFRKDLIHQRMDFLSETRLQAAKGGERPFNPTEIASGVGISRQHVYNILNRARGFGAEILAETEEFFKVRPGWCTRTEGQALVDFLHELTTVALPELLARKLRKDIGAVSIAGRITAEGGKASPRDLFVAYDVILAELRKHQGDSTPSGDTKPA